MYLSLVLLWKSNRTYDCCVNEHCFSFGFAFLQVFNEMNSRDIEKINVFRGMLNSRIFLGVMVGTVVFQVIIIEFLGDFASTVPLSWQLWLLSVLLGSVSLLVAVILKCIPVEKTTSTTNHHDGYDALPSSDNLA